MQFNMQLQTELYESAVRQWPQNGKHIIAQQTGDEIVVYQAYQPAIAAYAVAHQTFGGPDYSYNRMSWIKPNFLWMMYRCGWAGKEGQERVLAISMEKSHFITILSKAVLSSYKSKVHNDENAWKQELKTKDVRLQWDPDHDPYGKPLGRRAIQLGLKDEVLRNFGQHYIRLIEDITPFVKEQKQVLETSGIAELLVPIEHVFKIEDPLIRNIIGADS